MKKATKSGQDPGSKPESGTALAPVGTGGLLMPVASLEDLRDTFRKYLDLKEKLLSEYDYTWFAIYGLGQKEDMKGFRTKKEAEKFLEPMKKRNVACRVEKRIKKSGCLKLGIAFGISTEIVKEDIQPPDYARYVVRATAPNGQVQDRNGACARVDRGRANSPFDHIDAVALTRATDRAIMGVLGGETTAEEFEDVPDDDAVEAGKNSAGEPTVAKTKEEKLQEIDAFAKKVGAGKPVEKQHLIGRVFGALDQTGVSKEDQEKKLKATLKRRYKVASIKDLSDQQLIELESLILKAIKKKPAEASAGK